MRPGSQLLLCDKLWRRLVMGVLKLTVALATLLAGIPAYAQDYMGVMNGMPLFCSKCQMEATQVWPTAYLWISNRCHRIGRTASTFRMNRQVCSTIAFASLKDKGWTSA